ncbi:APC family permease [Enterocloster aldenensis]|uniref:APC family permease n=1 Tax=Enterocloster aldenensis TaxID=358742 RepID=UPI00402525A4
MSKTKKLRCVDLVAISSGQVIGAGVVSMIGTAITCTGMSAWLAYGAAIVVGFLSIIPFILISSTIMLKGGEYTIVANMLNEKAAGFYAISYIAQCLSLSVMGTSLAGYVTSIFPNVNGILVGLLALTFFFLLNLAGVKVMASVQKPLTAILIICLLVFGFYGMTHVNPSVFQVSAPGFFSEGYEGFAAAISVYAFSTYGQYMVMNFGKDAENPTRDVPIAIMVTTAIIFVVYVSVAIVNCGVLPIEEVAGKPLTLTARKIFGVFFPLFIIGGPAMALLTTMNAQFGSRSTPLLKATLDGWFPAKIGKVNNRNVPYIIMALIYLVGIIPICAGLSIKTISNNLALIGYLSRAIAAIAIVRLPKKMPEEWKRSFLHMPDGLFYTVMAISFAANIYMVYIGAKGLPVQILGINLVFIVACVIYAVVRFNSGKVTVDRTLKLERED